MGLGDVATKVLFCGNYCRAFTMSTIPSTAPTLCCRWRLARPIFMCLGNASIDRTLISLNPQSLELTSATVTCDCGVTGMHWEQRSLKYRINVQIRFVCLFMSTAFKFQTRPAMQQTIPAETAEDSRVAERFNYDQSTVLVWIYTAVLLQWTRPAD